MEGEGRGGGERDDGTTERRGLERTSGRLLGRHTHTHTQSLEGLAVRQWVDLEIRGISEGGWEQLDETATLMRPLWVFHLDLAFCRPALLLGASRRTGDAGEHIQIQQNVCDLKA